MESLKGQGDEKPLQLAALKQRCKGKDSDSIKMMVVMSADDLRFLLINPHNSLQKVTLI